MHKVALIKGDGIGPEISESTVKILEASGAKINWIETPIGQEARRLYDTELPLESLDKIREIGFALKSPLIAERCSGGIKVERDGKIETYPSINNGLRRELGIFANLRPTKGWEGISGTYQKLDILIVREATEDTYSGIEAVIDDDQAHATKVITRFASERVAHYACDVALRWGRKRVTAVHKANVLHLTDGLFLKSVRSVMKEYPTLEFNDQMVDAACYHLIKNPQIFDVLVLPNQYGDIISDVAAGLIGSMGLAPGINIGAKVAMFEAAHGAAPDIAGKNIANPIALALSGSYLLDHINEKEAGERVRQGVAATLKNKKWLTPDLGGQASTEEMTKMICKMMEEG
jgi:isocitrate dehydrogenase (NAD+)